MEPWVATVASSVEVEPDYEMNPTCIRQEQFIICYTPEDLKLCLIQNTDQHRGRLLDTQELLSVSKWWKTPSAQGC